MRNGACPPRKFVAHWAAGLRLAAMFLVVCSLSVATVHAHDEHADHDEQGDLPSCAWCLAVAGKTWADVPDAASLSPPVCREAEFAIPRERQAVYRPIVLAPAPRGPPSVV
jgi:hypothetical protein